MASEIYLVVGASRGIGKALIERLSSDAGNHVIATTRKPTSYPASNLCNLVLDQSSSESVEQAAKQVAELDTLVINAAIGEDEKLLATSEERMLEYLDTNVMGVHRVVSAFLPALRARQTRKIIIVSSSSGSLEKQLNVRMGFGGPYGVTKAANNMQAVQLHRELYDEGFTVIPLHPGWVATDMGGVGGMPAMDSARQMVEVIQKLKHINSGTFYQYDGGIVPW